MSLQHRLQHLRDRIGGVLDDFTHLEVNTIIKPGMTAQKMPSMPHALHDLVGLYAGYLTDTCKVNLAAFFVPDADRSWPMEALRKKLGGIDPTSTDARLDERRLTNEWRTFWRLRYAARWAEKALDGQGEPDELRAMCLARIKSNCDLLFGLLEPLESKLGQRCEAVGLRRSRQALIDHEPEPHDFSPRLRTVVRKAWELGLEQVLMQTVVQLDGDVVTRMTPDVASGRHPQLNRIHLDGVETGTSVWRRLIEIIESIARIVT